MARESEKQREKMTQREHGNSSKSKENTRIKDIIF